MKSKANDIGQHLVKLRLRRGLTQENLAAKLQISGSNMTRQVIANIEARRRRVTEQHIRDLVKVLRCSFDELFLGIQPLEHGHFQAQSKSPRR
jgi:transcriptional regulator with XRE-family HTH domain